MHDECKVMHENHKLESLFLCGFLVIRFGGSVYASLL